MLNKMLKKMKPTLFDEVSKTLTEAELLTRLSSKKFSKEESLILIIKIDELRKLIIENTK
jgi:hypothetical protein